MDERKYRMSRYIYDIRSSENALKTLTSLSGVPLNIWEKYIGHESEYEYMDDLVEEIVTSFGVLPLCYKDFEFNYLHVTTSANECKSFLKNGIMDLKETYLNPETELREFLDKNDVHFYLDECKMVYGRNTYDIHFSPNAPRAYTEEYHRWCIGRKFYYDFTSCGFLSVSKRSPYGGQVEWRPEILSDIDRLLKTDMSIEWAKSHKAYEIVARVSGDKILYNGYDGQTDREKVIRYLTTAYYTAFGEPSEEIILLKNHSFIPPNDIIAIEELSYWRKNKV